MRCPPGMRVQASGAAGMGARTAGTAALTGSSHGHGTGSRRALLAGARPGRGTASRQSRWGAQAPSHPAGPALRARRVLPRLRRLRRELRAEPPLLPVLPPPSPRAPPGSGGCRRPLRQEKEEAPRATGAGSKAKTGSEQRARSGGQHPCPKNRVSGNALIPAALAVPSHPSVPFSAPSISPPHSLSLPTFSCPFPSPVPPLAPARLTVPFSCPAGGPPGESAADWCLYQLNGAAEFEVSEGE